VSPWSRAEAGEDGSARGVAAPASDERAERELFARRARALGPAGVPTLAAVLRAADVAQARGARRARPLAALALAAACVGAVWVGLPGTNASRTIVADLDAGALPGPYGEARSSAGSQAGEESTCTNAEGNVFASTELRACVAQPVTFTALTPPRAQLACEREEACSTSGP
jgi:hypothetical protein